MVKKMFLTNLKQICNLCLIKFSENQSAPKLENRKTSPCSPCAPNLLHVLISRIPGYHNLCSPDPGHPFYPISFPQITHFSSSSISHHAMVCDQLVGIMLWSSICRFGDHRTTRRSGDPTSPKLTHTDISPTLVL